MADKFVDMDKVKGDSGKKPSDDHNPSLTTSDYLNIRLPPQDVIAPVKQPLVHATIHQVRPQQPQHRHFYNHSLSPEKLGVVGYVKDVAGFVQDVIRDIIESHPLQRVTKKDKTIEDEVHTGGDKNIEPLIGYEQTGQSLTGQNNSLHAQTSSNIPSEVPSQSPIERITTKMFPNLVSMVPYDSSGLHMKRSENGADYQNREE